MQPFDGIVLSGGGTKGMITLGVLHFYHEKGMLEMDKIEEFAGTSIGSAICLLLICGYSPMDIFSRIYKSESFFDDPQNRMWEIIEKMGIMSVSTFSDKIEEMVKEKFSIVPTLSELENLTGKKLFVSAVNVSSMREEKYSASTHPDLGCVDAIKMSCNLPLIFQRIKYDCSYVVDGGLINNFPWNYLVESKNALGIVVTGSDSSLPDKTFLGYFYRLMVIPINALTELRCRLVPPNVSVVRVEWSGPIFQMSMTSNQKMDMFLNGYREAEFTSQSITLPVRGWVQNDSPTSIGEYQNSRTSS